MDEKKSLTVKEWADEDKPREKMLSKGKKQLTNAELIAILLRSGLQGKSVVDVSREILDMAGNRLTTLSRMDYHQLSSLKGMGAAKATTLMAALELGWRMQGEIAAEGIVLINSSTDIFNYMAPLVIDLSHEEFWAIFMNNQHKVVGRQRISMGGQTTTPVDLRILFRGAIENKATCIAVMHNHPSGTLKPSSEDKSLTSKISEACKLFDIKLLDHIIIALTSDGKADYYSFADNGLI